jgi:hypothetical protein
MGHVERNISHMLIDDNGSSGHGHWESVERLNKIVMNQGQWQIT